MANPNAAFDATLHCTHGIQEIVGLREPMVAPTRIGDRTRAGMTGYDVVGVHVHMQPPTRLQANDIWDQVPNEVKDDPPNARVANALAVLANNAGVRVPDAIANVAIPRVRDNTVTAVTHYCAPGSIQFTGLLNAKKFIAFLHANMDDGSRIKWYDMTGRQQWEWYQAWLNSAQTHLRTENNTRGLKGTDLTVLVNVDQLRDAMLRSPSLARYPKPNHIPQNRWNAARNGLDPAIFFN